VGRIADVGWPSALVACLTLALIAPAGADETDAGEAASSDGLSGRAIYERVADNRFTSFAQESVLLSADRVGRVQESRFSMKWKDFSDEDGRDVLSKTLVKYTHPFDLRYAGYLIQVNRGRPNDQFVYYPSRRRVVRVNLRSEAVYGTDFSFEDIVPRELEDADYRRHPDAELDGVPCYVVEAIPRPDSDSEYSRFLSHVEKERNVPLLVRYWDDRGLEIKELRVRRESIERVEDVWVPMHMTMRNLRHDTFTTLVIEELEPNPTIAHAVFDLRRLETH
jgi:hypothetical protein